MILKIIIFFLFTIPVWAWAKGNEELPIRFIFFQILNFSVFVVALVYLVRKKIPVFLKQKSEDFLEYRRRAIEQENQKKKDCLLLEREVQNLVEKEKNISQSVTKALSNLKDELEIQEKQWLESLKSKTTREIKLRKFKEFNGLRNRLLFQVMQQTKEQLGGIKKESAIQLDQIVRKWSNR